MTKNDLGRVADLIRSMLPYIKDLRDDCKGIIESAESHGRKEEADANREFVEELTPIINDATSLLNEIDRINEKPTQPQEG
jgi:hypothetical protein